MPDDIGKIKKGFDLYKGIYLINIRQGMSKGIHLHYVGCIVRKKVIAIPIFQVNSYFHRTIFTN